MRARPTTYRGIRMRSRLEAAYAASLHGLATWKYEPECFADETGQYLPDFLVSYTHHDHVYVEIKPTVEQAHLAMARMNIILSSHPNAHLTVVIPRGTWPHVTFTQIASRQGIKGEWIFPVLKTPGEAARAALAARRSTL